MKMLFTFLKYFRNKKEKSLKNFKEKKEIEWSAAKGCFLLNQSEAPE